MKHLLFIFALLFATCAVQGPISGGPVDNTPPILLNIVPKNFTTDMNHDQEITLIFDEPIDPSSINSSLEKKENYKIKNKGRKIIISPLDSWTSNLIHISINRSLKDFQGNKIIKPINLYFSTQSNFPTNKITGKIIDANNFISCLISMIIYCKCISSSINTRCNK